MAATVDYQSLITTEHAQQPLYRAVIAALVAGFADTNNVVASMPAGYDVDVAAGVQLDSVGLWVGISRNINVPLINAYFSLDTTGIGFDGGVWRGQYDASTGVISLDDGTYRQLIKTKIGANQWDGTLSNAALILSSLFAGTSVFLVDNQDMSMIVGLSGVLPSALFIAIFKNGLIPLRPSGVLINYTVTTVDGTPIFGFDVQNQYISGFDVGAWGSIGTQETRNVVPVAPTYVSIVVDGAYVLSDGNFIQVTAGRNPPYFPLNSDNSLVLSDSSIILFG